MFPPGPGRFARVMDHEDPTCTDPSTTPWGVRCNNPAHSHRSNIYGTFAVRGHWLQDKVSGPCRSCAILGSRHSSPCYKPNRLTVPKRDLFEAKFDLMDSKFDLAERTDGERRESERSYGLCLISELPYEILRQILDHVVPSGCTYQFIPSKQGLLPVEVVQKFVPASYRYPDVVELALAATCRILHRHICEVLYGENNFVFNIAVTPLVSLIRSEDFNQFESWSRLLQRHPQPLGPITAHTAPFLRRMSLLVVLPIYYYEKEVDKLHGLVYGIVEMLQSCDELQQLTVDFEIQSYPTSENKHLDVDRLKVEFDHHARKWNVDIRGVEPTRWLVDVRKDLQPLLRLGRMHGIFQSDF